MGNAVVLVARNHCIAVAMWISSAAIFDVSSDVTLEVVLFSLS